MQVTIVLFCFVCVCGWALRSVGHPPHIHLPSLFSYVRCVCVCFPSPHHYLAAFAGSF